MPNNDLDKTGFMDNEKLYNMIDKLTSKITDVTIELKETRVEMKKYNGLKIDILENSQNIKVLTGSAKFLADKINKIEFSAETKNKIADGIRNWGGWIFAILSLILLYKQTL